MDTKLESTLKFFVKRAKRLSESSVIGSYPKISIKIFSLNKEEPKSEYTFPTEEELESFFVNVYHFQICEP